MDYFLITWNPILTKIISFHTEVRNAKLKERMILASISQGSLDVLATRMDNVAAMLNVQDPKTTPASPDFFNCLIDLETQLWFVQNEWPGQNVFTLYKSIKGMTQETNSGRTIQYFLDILNPILDKIVSFQADVRNAKREVHTTALAAISQGSLDVLATRMDALMAMLHVQDQDATLDAPMLSNHLTQLQSQLISVNSECTAANLLTVVHKVGEMATEAQSGKSQTVQYFRDLWSPLLTEIITFQTNVANAKVEEAKANRAITAPFLAVGNSDDQVTGETSAQPPAASDQPAAQDGGGPNREGQFLKPRYY